MIALLLIAGIFICFAKFLPNLVKDGSAMQKDLALWPAIKKAMAEDPRMIDAMKRVSEPGRLTHDLTNLLIEFFRFLFKTWEQLNPDSNWVASTVVKALSFAIVAPWIIVIFLVLYILWRLA